MALAKPLLSLVSNWRLTTPENMCVEQQTEPSCSGSLSALLVALEQQRVSTVAAVILKV